MNQTRNPSIGHTYRHGPTIVGAAAMSFGSITGVAATATTDYSQTSYITGGAAMSQQPSSSHGTSVPPPFMELVDAKLEAVEARTDTKFAQLMGKIELIALSVAGIKADIESVNGKIGTLDTKLDTVDGHSRSAKREIMTAVIATGLAVIALAWAGVQIFQGGIGIGISAVEAQPK